MRNLFRFLRQYHVILLFVLLETISVMLLINSHTYHRAATISFTGGITGVVYESWNSITSYFSLRYQNEKLAAENARLRSEITHLKELSDSTSRLNSDFKFTHIPAKVVSNSVHFRNNYILINKGRLNGVKPDMGIISPDGVAGIITGVSDNYSTALSLLHHHARISVMFHKTGQLANLGWDGYDYKFGIVEDIPSHLVVKPGDTIVTSGHSLIFPEGLMVGTVTEYIKPPGSSLNKAILQFSTDFNKLRQVYVVYNIQQTEIDSLVNSRQDE
jgi:rod shape-determining protein MreC